jgi:hypothetical protein
MDSFSRDVFVVDDLGRKSYWRRAGTRPAGAHQLHKSQIILQHNVLPVCWFTHRYSWVHGRMRIIYVTAAVGTAIAVPQKEPGGVETASRPSRPPTYWLRLKEGGSSNDN